MANAPAWEHALYNTRPTWLAALGKIPGMVTADKFGENTNITSGSVPETVWLAGGLYPWQAAAFSAGALSSDAGDSEFSVGAQIIRVEGLDGVTQLPRSEDVALSGLAEASIPGTWWRINRVYVVQAGPSGANLGVITVGVAFEGAVQAQIPIGRNQTALAAYTIPKGHLGMVTHFVVSAVSSGGANIEYGLFIRNPGGVFRQIALLSTRGGGSTQVERSFDYPSKLEGLTDIEVRVVSTSATAGVKASFEVLSVLIPSPLP